MEGKIPGGFSGIAPQARWTTAKSGAWRQKPELLRKKGLFEIAHVLAASSRRWWAAGRETIHIRLTAARVCTQNKQKNGFADRAAVAHARDTARACRPSHVPSDTAGEHDTSTPVLVRPRGRAPTSESGVREHNTPHFRCSSRTTRTRTQNDHQSGMVGSQSAALRTKKNQKFPTRAPFTLPVVFRRT